MEIKTGRYDNLTLEQYHRECPGWSKSSLDKVHRSMAHYFAEIERPRKQTEAMLLGSAFHCSILEPSLFENEYCVIPECDRRTKEGKAIYAQFEFESVGKTGISYNAVEQIEGMKKAVYEHPIARNLFLAGDAEHSFFWIDKETGLLCKCRPDYLRKDGICIELKTTRDASYESFKSDVGNFRYYVQAAYFIDGIKAAGFECNEFLFCAVETDYPHNVNIFRLDSEALAVGRVAYKQDLRRVKAFFDEKESDRWAGYMPIVNDLYLPNWIK